MKKLAVLLSLVMVLGLSVSAFAGVTGEVKYGFEKEGDVDAVWTNSMKFTVKGGENASASIEVGDKDVVTSMTPVVDESGIPTGDFDIETGKVLVVKKAWIDYKDETFVPVSFKAGQFGVKERKTVTGFQADATVIDGLTAGILYLPSAVDNKVGFQAKYATSFAPVDVEAEVYSAKAVYNHDYKVVGKATYNVTDAASVYGKVEYTDEAAFFVGGEAAVAGVDLTADFDVDAKLLELAAEKSYNGLIFAAGYDMDFNEGADNTLSGSVKVKF